MVRVGIYARTSKAEGGDETTVPVQLADCRERAEAEGWEVAAEYTDPGITGWKRKTRPGYERLFAAAQAGRIDAVLARDYERLLRNDREGQRWLDLFESHGFADFRFADEADINLRRARDRKDWKERVAAAVYYSDRLSEKMKRTKRDRKTRGTYTGGGPVFGYTPTPDGLAVDPEQAGVVHDAVKRLSRHETVYRIVTDWNAAGITTANGKRWNPKTVRRMLTGEHLTGSNGYPRILTDVEAAVVRQELGEQPKLKARASGRRFPLVGLLYCSECGVKLTTGGGYYRCSASHGGCGAVTQKAFPLERYIALEGFRHYIDARRSGKRKKQPQPQTAVDASPILEELRDVERRIEEVAVGLADGTLTVVVAGNASRKLEERRRTLTEQLARTLPPVEAAPTVRVGDIFTRDEVIEAFGEVTDTPGGDYADDSFRRRWETQQLEAVEVGQLRDLFADVLERATISPRERRGHNFDPDRVSLEWRTA